MNTPLKPLAASIALALLPGPTAAATYQLCAKAAFLSLPSGAISDTDPGGGIPIWGYADNASGDCTAPVQIPGPTLVNDGTPLTIELTNQLPEPTSLIIPGQPLPDGSAPTWSSGSGPRPIPRVRSFGTEVDPQQTLAYVWSNLTGNGTLLYHSGTHPQKQVYMGLAGLVTNDSSPGSEAYPGATYDNSATLYFSDIDPAFNTAVADGTLETAIDRHPTWFLINGEAYEEGLTADISEGDMGPLRRGEETLLRLASTTTDTHVAVLQGLDMTLHGEDGFRYNWQDPGLGTATAAPRVQYSAMLPPTKTKDAVVVVAAHNPETPDAERFAVYDGNGYMTNPSDPNDSKLGDTVGGMLRFLSFAPSGNTPPVADPQGVTIDEDPADPVAVTLTGSDGDGDPLTFSVVSGPTNGTLSGTAPDLGYRPNADFNGSDSFDFVANDGTVDSVPATVDITVNPVNDAPVADAQAVSTNQGAPVDITLTGSDVDGDALTFSVQSAPANGILSGTAPDLTYTPNAGYLGPDSFTFVANDGTLDSGPATVTIDVTEPNTAPVADPQSVTIDEDPAQAVGVTLTGSDVDNDPLTFSVLSGPTNGTLSGTAPDLGYMPNADFNGSDGFTYVANDGTVESAPATVDITVNPVNDAPAADAQAVSTNQDVPVDITLTGSDVDGDALTFSVQTAPANGTLDAANLPDVTYTPNTGYVGTDSFTFVANDGTVDSPPASVDITVNEVVVTTLYFSTVGAGAVPGVSGPFDDADVYSVDSADGFARLYDAVGDLGLPNNANIDALSIAGGTVYLSFAGSNTSVPGLGGVPDEDVVAYDTATGTWSTYFDGSVCGLDGSNGLDVDAISVSGGTLHFSILKGGNRNPVAGVAGDAASIYQWSGGNCDVALDAGAAGLQNANVDGLTVSGSSYYLSFSDLTSVPILGNVQDESVVVYDPNHLPAWTLHFSGTGQLDGTDAQDIDAFQVPQR